MPGSVTWRGTMTFTPEDADVLRGMGVRFLSEPVEGEGGVLDADVELDQETLNRFDGYWGRFVWCLDMVEPEPEERRAGAQPPDALCLTWLPAV